MSANRDFSKQQKVMLLKYKQCPFAPEKVRSKMKQKRINHKNQTTFQSANWDILLLNRNR